MRINNTDIFNARIDCLFAGIERMVESREPQREAVGVQCGVSLLQLAFEFQRVEDDVKDLPPTFEESGARPIGFSLKGNH